MSDATPLPPIAPKKSILRSLGFGLLLSLALLGAVFSVAKPGELWATAQRAAMPWLIAAIALHLLGLLLRVSRWRRLLEGSECWPLKKEEATDTAQQWLIFDTVFFGWLGNLVLPAKLGEFLAPALFAKRAQQPFARVLGTVVIERTMDLLVLGLFFLVATTMLPPPEALPDRLWGLVGLFVGAGLLALALSAALASQRGTSRFPFLQAFSSGVAALRSPKQLGMTLILTTCIWTIEVLCAGFGFLAFAVTPSTGAATLQVVSTTFSVALITAPLGLGVEQGASALVLGAYGIDPVTAVAISFLLSFAALIWIVPLGLLAMWRQGARLTAP